MKKHNDKFNESWNKKKQQISFTSEEYSWDQQNKCKSRTNPVTEIELRKKNSYSNFPKKSKYSSQFYQETNKEAMIYMNSKNN